jgi:UDP-glucuronate decarboxylase
LGDARASASLSRFSTSLYYGSCMRILITGGAGFLGSHLCDRLLELGHEVISMDNFYTGSQKNLVHLQEIPNFKSINHDVTLPVDLKVDGIFNLACPASPPHYQNDPVQTMKTNVHGAINILELARSNGARVLQASTSEVYGDPEIHPQVEEYWGRVNPIGIRACYDEGKRAAETLFFDYHRQYDIDIRVARIFNTYGPRMSINDGRVITNFISQALNNRPLTIYGDGKQTRSFCYVSDLINGLTALFFAEEIYQPINIGNPKPITMLDLASEIIRLTNSKSEINFLPLPSDDPKDREPEITKAKLLLAWEPEISREAGLVRTIEDIRKQMLLK